MPINLVTSLAILSVLCATGGAVLANPLQKKSTQADLVLRELKLEKAQSIEVRDQLLATQTVQPADAIRTSKKSESATIPQVSPIGAENNPDWRSELVLRAMTLLGVGYKFGGNSPELGLDCSGFVRLVVKDALGKVLPRRSVEISEASTEIKSQELKPGDLVFFNTLKRAFSHVGIYIGNNQFIHAPSSGGVVRIETLDKQYWNDRFNGARRIVGLPDSLSYRREAADPSQ
jgi:cell wall-associated NlpC family hydrolase